MRIGWRGVRGSCGKQGKAEEGEEQEQAEKEKVRVCPARSGQGMSGYTLNHKSKYKTPPFSSSSSNVHRKCQQNKSYKVQECIPVLSSCADLCNPLNSEGSTWTLFLLLPVCHPVSSLVTHLFVSPLTSLLF